jgi:hypothetical protein
MNRQDVADWFQIVASFGVLIGLIFVGLELQQTRSLAQATLLSETYSDQLEINRVLLGENPMPVLSKVCSGEDLTQTEDMIAKTFYGLHYLITERWITLGREAGFDAAWRDTSVGVQLTYILGTEHGQEYFEAVKATWPPEIAAIGEQLIRSESVPPCSEAFSSWSYSGE